MSGAKRVWILVACFEKQSLSKHDAYSERIIIAAAIEL
jgi:hypothetical protein